MKFVLFVFWVFTAYIGNSQRIYAVLNLSGEFSGISYAGKHVKEEFKPSVAKIGTAWRADFIFKAPKIAHKISIEEAALSKNFKIINKFKKPPYNEPGFDNIVFGTAIDHLIIAYSLQRETKKEKGFIFHSRLKFNYSAGIGISFNRTKGYYRDRYQASADGRQSPYTYEAYEATHYREGAGIFFKGNVGFDLFNKKKKRFLCFGLYYNQGLKTMIRYDVRYQYGYWNDPQRQVDVPHQALKGRGTTFGFSIGTPITIKK